MYRQQEVAAVDHHNTHTLQAAFVFWKGSYLALVLFPGFHTLRLEVTTKAWEAWGRGNVSTSLYTVKNGPLL